MKNNLYLKVPVCLLLLITLNACTTTPSRDAFTMPGELVDIGTHSLHLYCIGEGGPLVVLEAGAGIGSSAWQLVQGELARESRVCSYNRAGLVWSERHGEKISAQNAATELHQLLEAAGESGPVILVGHSLGGIYSRKYAELYPGEVAGVVLVDSSHPDQVNRGMGIFGLPLVKSVGIAYARVSGMAERNMRNALVTAPAEVRNLNLAYVNYSLPAIVEELDNVPAILEEVGGSGSLGNLPLTIIAADLQYQPEYGLNFQADPAQLAEQYKKHKALQEDLLKLSSASSLMIAERSGHSVPFEQPEIIVEAVLLMLTASN